MKKIASNELWTALAALGIDVNATRRVVIDIRAGHVPVIYTEHFDDGSVLSVVTALGGVEIKREETDNGGQK